MVNETKKLNKLAILDVISDESNTVFQYVAGKWESTAQQETLKFPYDDSEVCSFYVGTAEDVNRAIMHAKSVGKTMKDLPLWQRSEIIANAASYLEEISEEAAQLIVYETGKTIKDARGEILRTVSTLRFASEAAKDLHAETLPLDAMKGISNRVAFSIREPIGVVGAITGFNFPLLLAAHKLGPAFAGGNTVVLKPSPGTPITVILIAHIFEQAGLPSGALHVINGDVAVGQAIVEHEDVAAISFTGSSKVGRIISQQACYKKVLLELGSNAATIVDENSDLDEIADRCIAGGFGSVGQSCISVQRIIAHHTVYELLKEKLVERVKLLKVGHPLDETTDVSTLFTQDAKDRILDWIQEAQKKGAEIAIGGQAEGRLLQPTVIADTTTDMKVFQEEIFGPVITLIKFNDFDQAIQLANDSKYGLQVGVFTNNLQHSWQAIQRIEAGSVHINEVSNFRPDHMPYGGVKDSGIGKEGPKYVLEELTTLKVVSFKL